MSKLLYIDSCIRDEESRTKRIATPLINKLKETYDVETIILNDLNLEAVRKEELNRRMKGEIPSHILKMANDVKEADRIVIAAPFWDMSIPSVLKVFIELMSIINVTFKSNDVTCFGNCQCQKVLFITTRGMNIKTGDELEQASSYLKALSKLWGLGEVIVLARENFDYLPNEIIEQEIESAIEEGIKIIGTF